MRKMPWTTYLWPGLPQLWYWGYGSGLALAALSAALLNTLLLGSLVWVEWIGPWPLRLGWMAAGMLWMGSAVLSVWRGGGNPTPPQPASAEGLFRRALSEYLQGSWFEAESLLGQLLHVHPRDAEARLMLATLLRRTGRPQEALAQLARLELLRDSEKWRLEIASERERLAATIAAEPPAPSDPANETIPAYVSQQAA
jgi:hypothetical protein